MCILVFYSISVFLWSTGNLMIRQFVGIIFLLNINTGMNKIPSFRFYTGILPSSTNVLIFWVVSRNLPS